MIRPILFVLIVIWTVAQSGEVSINSIPDGAEVFMTIKGKSNKVGVTPYKADSDVFYSNANADYFFVEVIKKGHVPYRFLVSKISNIDIEIMAPLVSDSSVADIQKYDNMINNLLRGQQLIRSKNFDGAIELLTKLENEFSEFSIISELKGMAYYFGRRPEEALSSYRQAFSKNTQNVDAYKMKVFLEKKLNVQAQ